METILYNVPVPELDRMDEHSRNRATEDYMRESNRQIRLLTEQLGAVRNALRAMMRDADAENSAAAASAGQTAADAGKAALAAQTAADNAQDAADDAAAAAAAAQETADAAATPAQVAAAVAASEARYADYVTEYGTQDGWEYRKWSTGLVEMWACGLEVALGAAAAWTGELVYQNGTITFPFTMRDAETTNVDAQVVNSPGKTEVNGILLVASKTTTGAAIRFARKEAGTVVRLDIYVRGYLSAQN